MDVIGIVALSLLCVGGLAGLAVIIAVLEASATPRCSCEEPRVVPHSVYDSIGHTTYFTCCKCNLHTWHSPHMSVDF